MGSLLREEPVAVIAAVTALIEAVIALAVGFGLNWTQEQVGLVMAVVVAIGALVSTVVTRSRVSPVRESPRTQGVKQ